MNCQDQPKVEQKQEPIENLPVKPPKVEKPFTANDPEGKEITWNKDGAQMEGCTACAYYLDVYEVTVGQYKQFLKATGHRDLPDWISKFSPQTTIQLLGAVGTMPKPMLSGRGNDCRPKRSGNCSLCEV